MIEKNCGNCGEDSCVFQGDWGSKGCDFWINKTKAITENKSHE